MWFSEVERIARQRADDRHAGMAVGADRLDAAGGAEALQPDDGVVRAGEDAVGAAGAGILDLVQAGADADEIGVAAFAAVERVVAGTADDRVGARRSGECVVALAGIDCGDAGQRDGREVERIVSGVAADGDADMAVSGDRLNAARGPEAGG